METKHTRLHSRTPYLLMALMLMLTVGFEYFHLINPVPSVCAVSTTGSIGIYWDQSCTNTVSSINWGALSPGQTQKVTVYARNEGNQTIVLTVTSLNYSPANASDYLNYTWTSTNIKIMANETVQVTQSLYVSPTVAGISDFSFDIVFSGKGYILGDMNGDGVVNIYDAAILASAFGSHAANHDYPGEPPSPNWNPLADLNNDGVVDIYDSLILGSIMNQT